MKRDQDFGRKKDRAMSIMAARGMWRSNYAPPCHLFLWKLGFQVTPPPFSSFLNNFLCFTGIYTPFWGCVIWIVFLREQGVSTGTAFLMGLTAGTLVGLAMSAFQLWIKKTNRLPSWDKL